MLLVTQTFYLEEKGGLVISDEGEGGIWKLWVTSLTNATMEQTMNLTSSFIKHSFLHFKLDYSHIHVECFGSVDKIRLIESDLRNRK